MYASLVLLLAHAVHFVLDAIRADLVLLVDLEHLAAGDPDARIAWRKDNAVMLEGKDDDEKKENETVKTKAQACTSQTVS